MADIDSYTKTQRVDSGLGPPTSQNQPNTSKLYSHFLYKAAIVTVFLVIIPLFPSQAPEFINHTVFTRSWELLHLLFVGIAVSYGLFSRRSDETEKETHSKFDNAQSYVSRILQVSSVFDDEAETPSGSDENKVQTWNNQYYRGEPVVVVAQERSVLDEQRGVSSRISEKPLLLPVRSLKSRVSGVEGLGNGQGNDFSGTISRSNSNSGSNSKRFSRNSSRSRSGEFGTSDPLHLEEKMEENVVLPSPIPWRSRSGRMETEDIPSLSTLPPPAMDEADFNLLETMSFRSQAPRLSRPSPSPKKLSPSPSLSSETQAQNVEDMPKKKSFYKSSPPPPPPPPPPITRKSPLMKSNSSDEDFSEKEFRRSFTIEPKELSRSGREDMLRRAKSLVAEAKPIAQIDGLSMGKSVRTHRAGETYSGDGVDGKAEKNLKEVVEKTERKTVALSQTSNRTLRPILESVPVVKKPTMSNFDKKEESVVVETDDDDSDNEIDDMNGNPDNEKDDSTAVSDEGPDVDRKADEFIAKFREQIRLQRIQSIKRSSGQINRNSSSRCMCFLLNPICTSLKHLLPVSLIMGSS